MDDCPGKIYEMMLDLGPMLIFHKAFCEKFPKQEQVCWHQGRKRRDEKSLNITISCRKTLSSRTFVSIVRLADPHRFELKCIFDLLFRRISEDSLLSTGTHGHR